jgi:hypothetical protein
VRRGRLEAFSDGVVAILITIMVLRTERSRAGHRRVLARSPAGRFEPRPELYLLGITGTTTTTSCMVDRSQREDPLGEPPSPLLAVSSSRSAWRTWVRTSPDHSRRRSTAASSCWPGSPTITEHHHRRAEAGSS